MFRLSKVILCIVVLALVGIVSADVQTFDTSYGKVQLDVPQNYVAKEPSSTGVLQLVEPGSEKPIISVALDDVKIFGADLVQYAAMHFGEGKSYTEVQTDDGHRMLFYAFKEYGDIYSYSGIIDYTKDKGLIIDVFGRSETVAYGKILATFGEDEFLTICKSFAFVE